MVFQNNILSGVGGQGGEAAYEVDYSCRFDGANKAYLLFTPITSSAAQKTYTLSAWVKRGNIALRQVVIGCANASASAFSYALMAPNDTAATVGSSNSGAPSSYSIYNTNILFRDPSAWFHIMLVIDTTESLDTDRANIYYNGVKVTGYTTSAYPPQDSEMNMNNASYDIGVGTLGAWYASETAFDGYLAQVAQVSELALAPTDFGEFDDNGVWRPIDITELDYSGENSFLLDFADSSDLGNDVSGNNNDFTNSGLVASDQMTDTPTKNYAVLNPLANPDNTLSDGNLTCASTGTGWDQTWSTFAVTKKTYFEVLVTTFYAFLIGFSRADNVLSAASAPAGSYGAGIQHNEIFVGGSVVDQSNGSAITFAITDGDVVNVAIDPDRGAVWYGLDGTWKDGTASSASSAFINFSKLLST